MKSKTHRKITERILPDVDPKIVERINKATDKPEPWMPPFSPELGSMPGASHRGHRRKGHDLVTASIIGFLEGGPKGVVVALTHLGLDATRDRVVDKYGGDVADLVEDAFNIVDDLDKKTTRKRKGKGKAKVKNDGQENEKEHDVRIGCKRLGQRSQDPNRSFHCQ